MGNEKKLGLIGLIGIIIGAMVGGAIFSLPSQVVQGAGGFAIIIGWIIAGIGVFSLAFVYQLLSNKKSELSVETLFPFFDERGTEVGMSNIYKLASSFTQRFAVKIGNTVLGYDVTDIATSGGHCTTFIEERNDTRGFAADYCGSNGDYGLAAL